MNETINIEAGDMGIVVAFVLLVGGIIKNYTPIKNELIPLITWALGGLLYQWLAGGWDDPRQWMMALISVAGATGLHSATRSTVEAVKPPSGLGLWLICGLSLSLVGCARFTTNQTDASYENGQIVRQVTTKAQAVTVFEAKSALANFKASQTDKTQSASVGSLSQESAGATNAAAMAGQFLGELIKAAK